MNLSHRYLAIAAVLALPAVARAQSGICRAAASLRAAGATAGAVTPAEVCRVLSVLAHDSLEGRGTGTVGGAKAARFIAEEFRAAGLEPGGDSGYFQRVPIVWTGNGQMRPSRIASFALRDTFPAERRGIAVNVVGILRGSDPVL